MIRSLVAAACLALASQPASAVQPQPQPQPQPALSAQETAQTNDSLRRGRLIYIYDQAAWHTTDAAIEDVKDLSGVKGWVVVPTTNGLLVTYYGRDATGVFGLYEAVWTGTAVVDRRPLARVPLTSEQKRLIAVGDLVSSEGLMSCSDKPFNRVILPGARAGDPDSVYLLTPQTDARSFPFGGHHRFDVKDGKIVSKRGFTRSCIAIPAPPPGKKGKKVAGLMVTHLLDPVPTEIHVFMAFATGKSIWVGTQSNQRFWAIDVQAGEPKLTIMPAPKGFEW
jgi:hypothetical protein